MPLALGAPGVYIVEKPGPKTVQPVGTSVAAFIGRAPDAGAHPNEAVAVNNRSQRREPLFRRQRWGCRHHCRRRPATERYPAVGGD